MLERLPVRRHVRRLTMLTLVALLIGAAPTWYAPAAAQTAVDEDLVDTQAMFATGTFQRTAVNTGIVPRDANNNLPFADLDGTLQLAPVGSLRPWNTFSLPQGLNRAQMGVTAFGNKLFVIGGATTEAGSGFTDTALWTKIDPQVGTPVEHGLTQPPPGPGTTLPNDRWVNDPMPGVTPYMNPSPYFECDSTTPIAARAAPAVASYVGANGVGYIYVIGGEVVQTGLCTLPNFSVPVVQRGVVDPTSGDINWSAGDSLQGSYLPSQNLPLLEQWGNPTFVGLGIESLGVSQATASVVTTNSGNTYLYVIGGLITYSDGSGPNTLATPAVFYTRLGSDGSLNHPAGALGTPWARTANVPLDAIYGTSKNPGDLGIYGHTAMVAQSVVGTGTSTTVNSAIFVTGGYTLPGTGAKTANATVFRAKVNDQSGALTWATDLYSPAPDNETVTTEGQGRASAAGFAYSGKLYVLGGIESNQVSADPVGTAAVGVFNDSLDMLPLFADPLGGTARTFFNGSSGSNVFPAVQGLGAAVLPATPPPGATTVDGSAWGYAIGGFNTSNSATNVIAYGKIGGTSETTNPSRIPDGWYYSRYFNIRLAQGTSDESEAKIVSISWFSGVDRNAARNPNADIQIQFRRSKTVPCNEQAFAGNNATEFTQWRDLDAVANSPFYTKEGNVVNELKAAEVPGLLEDPLASCLQFRVYMTQNGSTNGVPNRAGDASLSPQLYRLAIQKIRPGDPDLFIQKFEIGVDASGKVSTFDLEIKNLNNDNLLNTVAVQGGQFPVVLCVERRDLDDPEGANFAFTPPAFPIPNADSDFRVDCAPLYRWIDPTETTPGEPFDLNTKWKVNFDGYFDGVNQGGEMNPVLKGFTKLGHYAVTAIIDPYDVVTEGGQQSANNRGENLNNGQPLIRRFTVTDPTVPPPDPVEGDKTIYLPMISKP